jgi:hypothetical protein
MGTTGLTTTIAACAVVLTSYQIWTIRDNAQRQLRAYVAPIPDSFQLITVQPEKPLVAQFKYKNFGATPANSSVPHGGFGEFVFRRDEKYEIPSNVVEGEGLLESRVILPNFEYAGKTFGDERIGGPTQGEIDRVASGEAVFVLNGTITYWDIFDITRTTEICAYFQGIKTPVQGKLCINHNKAY